MLRLSGRILHLVMDPVAVRAQLDGTDLTVAEATELGYTFGINTDLIINGAACTLGWTPAVLGPHFLDGFMDAIHKGDVQEGGFQILVAGDAWGSGSSREVAVDAIMGAGIQLVVADGFERIHRENLVYRGMPHTTDRAVLDRLIAGEDIDVASLYDHYPPFFRLVSSVGGILAFGTEILAGNIEPWYETARTSKHPMTIVEKIVAGKTWIGGNPLDPGTSFGVSYVAPGEQVLCEVNFRGVHEYTGGPVFDFYEQTWGNRPVFNPEAVAAFEDHFVLIADEHTAPAIQQGRGDSARLMTIAMLEACSTHHIRVHGPDRDLEAGVCHRLVVEKYASPGDIVVLTDSHTPTAGVNNAFAFGVGSSAMSFALGTGLIPVSVPRTVRIVLTGDPSKTGITPKDVVLHLIGDPYFREKQWANDDADTCVIQIGGPALDRWTVDEQSVIPNMSVEGGLMTGILEPNEPLIRFLMEQRNLSRDEVLTQLVYPDDDATYERVIEINVEEIPVTVATPGDSRNRARLADVGEVIINNVVIASCTGGSFEDLRAAADVLRGRQLANGMTLTVSPSSALALRQAERTGVMDVFRKVGAVITQPGCGSCIGNGPGSPLPGGATASATNRNFAGRMGSKGPVYLVSPAVAAASAITGRLTDPRDLPVVS